MSRPDWDTYFLEIAAVVAKRSTCPRLVVGCVITLDNRIVSTGYNGAPPGEPHCTEVGCDIVDNHCMRVVHAERNALSQLHELNSRMKIYITHEPCEFCRSAINRYNIEHVLWSHDYGVTES